MEQRRFHRVKFAAQGDLRHQGMTYQIRLENISMGGALLSSDDCIMIPEGDNCTLSIRLEAEEPRMVVTTQVMHSFFSMVGVRFVAFENDAELRLHRLLQNLACEPERPGERWGEIQANDGPKDLGFGL